MKPFLPLLLLLSVTVPAGLAHASKYIDAGSEKVLSDSAWAFGSMNSLKVRYAARLTLKGRTATLGGLFSFNAPNLLRLETTAKGRTMYSVSNNAKLYQQVSPNQYTVDDAPGMPAAVSAIWAPVPSAAPTVLGPLLLGQSPAGLFEYRKMKVTHRRSGGFDVVRAVPPPGQSGDGTIEMRFGVKDHLLYRIDSTKSTGGGATSTTFSAYQVNQAFPKGTFVFNPGKKLKKLAATPASQDPTEQFKIGSKPPMIVGRDLNGKLRSLNDFKGKIVLVDFWATWCGPCVAELPNVQRLYRQYHSRGFEVLSISLDDKKSDLTNFVKARKIPWTQLYSGKGWKDDNARRYNVRGIPFMILIGVDGRIVAVDPRGEQLEKEVAPLMKGWI